MMHLVLSEQATRVMMLIVAVVVAGAGLYHAQFVLAPAVLGIVVGIVVSPLAERLKRIGIPRVVVAGGVLAMTVFSLAILILSLEPLIWRLAARLPHIMQEIRGWIDTLAGVLRGIETISSEIEKTVGESEKAAGSGLPTAADAIWMAPNFGAQTLIFCGTLFFFVMTRPDLYRSTGAFEMTLCRADRAVARYFAAVTLVNAGLGVATGFAMGIIGLEGAILWGLAAEFLNFVFYLGPSIMIVSLLVAGLMQFEGVASLLPAITFLMLNLTEAQFATPAVVGQRLDMNPLVVFLSIVFGLWIWGPIGAIVALPVLVWIEVLLTPDKAQRLGTPSLVL